MKRQQRFTHRVTIGMMAEDAEKLDMLAAALKTDVSAMVRNWCLIAMANCGTPVPRPLAPNGGEHREVAR